MTGRTVVVDRNNGVVVFFAEGTYQVIRTFLHLRIGALDSVQLDAIAVTACINRGNRTATESDAIVITTNHNNLVASLRLFLQTIALGAVTYTTSQHDNLVVSIFGVVRLLMLEGENRTANQGLAKLVAEVAGTIRCLNQNLLRSLIQPLTGRHDVFPVALFILKTRVGGHVNGCACDRPRTDATTHTVADFTTRTRCGAVEGLYGSGEVVGLSFQRDDTLDILDAEIIARRLVGRSKLLYNRTLGKSYIVLVGRKNLVGVFLRGLLDHGKEA